MRLISSCVISIMRAATAPSSFFRHGIRCRPTHTASAPSASALNTSAPLSTPQSTNTGIRCSIVRTIEGILTVLLGRSLIQPRTDSVSEALLKVILDLIAKSRDSASSDPVVSAVIHSITASYNDPEFQVTQALLSTGYSKDYLRRRFLKETGLAPIDYLKQVRIRYAKSLLAQKETLRMPIGEIALRSGFYDAAYFCRSFRKETGMTPSEYIRRTSESKH